MIIKFKHYYKQAEVKAYKLNKIETIFLKSIFDFLRWFPADIVLK